MTRRRDCPPGRRAVAVLGVALLLAVAASALPAVSRLRTAATFTASATVTGNVVAPRTCSSATAWSGAVTGLSGLVDWIRFAETTGTTATDSAGGAAWTYSGTVTRGLTGALFCQAAPLGHAVNAATTTSRLVSPTAGLYSSGLGSYATGVTTAVWFMGSTAGEAGRLLGLGNSTTAGSTSTYTDRVLWVDAGGAVRFGTVGGTALASGTGYLDGRWHLAAVAMTSTSAVLYVDGVEMASSGTPSYRNFGASNVYWRVGHDASSTSGRKPAGSPTSAFTGRVDEVVIARSSLTAATVASLWRAGSAP